MPRLALSDGVIIECGVLTHLGGGSSPPNLPLYTMVGQYGGVADLTARDAFGPVPCHVQMTTDGDRSTSTCTRVVPTPLSSPHQAISTSPRVVVTSPMRSNTLSDDL